MGEEMESVTAQEQGIFKWEPLLTVDALTKQHSPAWGMHNFRLNNFTLINYPLK